MLASKTPSFLIERVIPLSAATDEEKLSGYLDSGQRSFRELVRTLEFAGVDLLAPLKVLDWGCGPGRCTLHLMEAYPNLQLTGIDVDAAAIDWLKSLSTSASFEVIDTTPPTGLPSESFDLIVNHSVLTHISAQSQQQWLAEMHRLLKPDGRFLTSIHGPSAFFTNLNLVGEVENLRARWQHEWLSSGFVFEESDTFVGGVHHDGYHTTFQTPGSLESLSEYRLELLLTVTRGDLNFQDMLVLRRRDPAEAARLQAINSSAVGSSAATVPGVSKPSMVARIKRRLRGEKVGASGELERNWAMAAMAIQGLGRAVGRLEHQVMLLGEHKTKDQ